MKFFAMAYLMALIGRVCINMSCEHKSQEVFESDSANSVAGFLDLTVLLASITLVIYTLLK